ncbi:MAG: hypothetical protein Q8K18_17445 [Burkholderiales bacterium]|nr:hypothetical protein [Burkholderiales bacterium]
MRIGIAAIALGLALAAPGHAQMSRAFPANGKLGELTGQQHPLPMVQIDRAVVRLAPGARIVDQNNRSIVHGALPDYAQVLYVLDISGDISRIIILTPEEVARVQQTIRP